MPLGRADEELSLPRSTIDKIITHNKLGVPRPIRELLIRYCDNFISYVALQANLLCEKQKRKTISHEHIIKALENMGFSHYIKECKEVYQENVNLSKMKPSKINKLKTSKFTIEELKEQQDKLFENARREYENMELNEEKDEDFNES